MLAFLAATRAMHFSKISPTTIAVPVYLVCGLFAYARILSRTSAHDVGSDGYAS
jgi:hypothetical protein